MHELIELLSSDMKPALGVTEPGAIAYAVSTACSYLSGRAERVDLRLNSGIYKNAFTCGIPNSTHLGNLYAAALGAIAANPELGLECLSTVTPEDNTAAETMIKSGAITAEVSEISSRIHIEAMVYCGDESATVIIRDSHTNISCIKHNGKVVMGNEHNDETRDDPLAVPIIHKYTLSDFVELIETVSYDDIAFIREAYEIGRAHV